MEQEPQSAKSLGSLLPKLEDGNCERHGAFSNVRVADRPLTCPVCTIEKTDREVSEATKMAERNRKDAQLKAVVYHSGIPPRFRSKTFDGFQPADEKQSKVLRICQAYAHRFDERLAAGGGLVMVGLPGTGKTHLACAIGNHLLEAGRSVLFISVLAAARRVKATYSKSSTETEQQAIDRFCEPDLLILDEVGVQFGSEAEKLIVFEIINGRYERVKPTILLSNLPEAELGAFIGDRVLDRMREGGGVVLPFDWESMRKDIKTASTAMPDWVVK